MIKLELNKKKSVCLYKCKIIIRINQNSQNKKIIMGLGLWYLTPLCGNRSGRRKYRPAATQ